MTDRVPGAPGQYQAAISTEELQKMQEGEPFTITMTRDDQPITQGTPYSKAAVLPDALAAKICPNVADPTPADAFSALNSKLGKIRRGTTTASFSDGVATLKHNCGFASSTAYTFLWTFQSNKYIPVYAGNVDGNSVKISALDYSDSGVISPTFTKELVVNWIAIGL